MSDKDKAMQQALEALECMIDDLMYKDHKRVIDISNVAITALRTALEQQQAEPPPEWPLIKNILAVFGLDAIAFVAAWKAAQQQSEPVQKLVAWGVFDGNLHDMFFTEEEAQEMVRLKGDGSTVAPLYTTPPQQQSEPVSMRMPKVGDKVICLEDESLGEVVSLTAGGSPDILFDDGSHGTYLLREFAELFGYVASPLPVQEPVAWDKPSDSFNEWWDSDRRRDNANPFDTDSFAYWAFEGWQAARLKEKNT